MTPLSLLSTCEQAGVVLRLDGGKLKACGQEHAITRFLPLLRVHREALKAILTAEEIEFYEERAAIAEFDGGLSRISAEDQARNELQARHHKRTLH